MTTLARLSFWVPTERRADFESAYTTKLKPLLQRHDLEESTQEGRSTTDGVFSRLFEVESPGVAVVANQALRQDAAWQEALERLSTDFGDGISDYRFGIYRTPSGPGRGMAAGAGKTKRSKGKWHRTGAGRTTLAGGGVQHGLWHVLDASDGLPASAVVAIHRDQRGFLWFGTWGGGVSRYDGELFTNFAVEDGLADDSVGAIAEDEQGRLWFGTKEGGVSRYDGEFFTNFTVEDGLGTNRVGAILVDRHGHVWFGRGGTGMGGGVSRYDGEFFTNFTVEDGLADDTVTSITEDLEGGVWIGTQAGASRYDGKRFVSYGREDGLPQQAVHSIGLDHEGNVWFGTFGGNILQEGGLYRYDGETFTTFDTVDGLGHSSVTAMRADSLGRMWFCTWSGGVSCYDGDRFSTFTMDDGLADNISLAVEEDREGSIWVGSGAFGLAGAGVSRYVGEQFQVFTTDDGLAGNNAICILEDRQGQLWFGTWTGASRYDGECFSAVEGMEAHVRCILEDRQGQLWFGTAAAGVFRYDGEQWTQFTMQEGLSGQTIYAMLEDRSGNLWFGFLNDGGICCYDGEQWVNFNTENGLPEGNVEGMVEDRQGYLWFATRCGLCRFDGKDFKSFTTRDGLAGNEVNCLLEDRHGRLWVGCKGGVSCFDGKHFTNYTAKDGLVNNYVISILEDRRGHLWFSSYGGGVSRYDGLVFQTLHRRNGLSHNAVQQVLQDRAGDFWIATDGGGVTRYRSRTIAPTMRLTNVTADREYGPLERLIVNAAQQLVTFEFSGCSFGTSLEQMVYVYRLWGRDEVWGHTRQRRVAYEDLDLGDYTFEVKAVDRDLNYSEAASVQVSVVPDPHLAALNEVLSQTSAAGEFVGKSAALQQVQQQLAQVAGTDLTVLIQGETGTGKGLAARTLHALSERRSDLFIQVNCGAIPQGLVESELFGHEKGAFTGAVARKLGKVELAEEGTLFLDEIGDMPLDAQVKLLRLLEEKIFERVGGTVTLMTGARIIAATNRDLKKRVEEGTFREDLYFRLQVFPVQLPPLRQRREDIPLLATYFAEGMAAHLGKEVAQLDRAALARLQDYEWPGNVRELEHVVGRAVVLCQDAVVRSEDIGLGQGKTEQVEAGLVTLEEHERRYILRVLEETDWVIKGAKGAAAVLGLHDSTLRSRMRKLEIKRPVG